MKPSSGTYALLLRANASADIEVGHWGRLRLEPGSHVYVGSAFGPGGVRARVSRHFRGSKRKHWHIDYLRAAADPVCAWCSCVLRHLEHEWARAFGQMHGASCIRGFGCSDCRCEGHLFAMARAPERAAVFAAIGNAVERYHCRASA